MYKSEKENTILWIITILGWLLIFVFVFVLLMTNSFVFAAISVIFGVSILFIRIEKPEWFISLISKLLTITKNRGKTVMKDNIQEALKQKGQVKLLKEQLAAREKELRKIKNQAKKDIEWILEDEKELVV